MLLKRSNFVQPHGVFPARITRRDAPGLQCTAVIRPGVKEYHISAQPLPDESLEGLVARVEAFILGTKSIPVRLEIFGPREAWPDFERFISRRRRGVHFPVTWVEGLPCEKSALCGLHCFSVAEVEVETIHLEDRAVGRVYSDPWARYALLADILPSDRKGSLEKQAMEAFQNMRRALRNAGMNLQHLARTWLFLDNILGWYGPFNQVRREFFEQYRLFDHLVPASTGIGARNTAGAAITAGGWAVQPLEDNVSVFRVDSPLQCSAHNYGSCFSRAVEIDTPDLRRLFVSGTASISPEGITEHVGDIKKQIARTMDVVDAILASREMKWADTTRATVYIKRKEDYWAFAEYCLEHELCLPMVVTEADVCRDELLFEIELDALAAQPFKKPADWEV